MAEIKGENGKMFLDGKEITTGEWSIVLEDEDGTPIEIPNFEGVTWSFEGKLAPEATEPLGFIDHLLWGGRLN